MTGLSKITDKILADARADAAELLAQAEKKSSELAGEYARQAQSRREQIDESTKREAAEIVARAKSGEAAIRRNVILEAKSAQIDRAFDLAKKELLGLSEERYAELLLRLLVAACRRQAEDERLSRELYGEEDAPIADCYEVLLNERDGERFGEALIASVREQSELSAKTVVLSSQRARIDGGLILRCGNTEINCSVQALIEQIRPTLEGKVSRKLFPEKKGSGV